jgi:hypothetical protein
MWKSVSCEVQGLGHVRNDVPCQDKTICLANNGVQVIALADGAGSAPLSHYGAQCVVKTVAELLTDNFEELYDCTDGLSVKQQIVSTISIAIEAKADELKCATGDLASTLLFVAATDDKYILGHIGDGIIGYLSGMKIKVAFPPSNGEFANETVFITSNNAIKVMNLAKGRIGDIIGFTIMSDGTEASLYHKPSGTLSNIVTKLISRTFLTEQLAMQKQLLSTFENVIRRKTQDDCSIAIIARSGVSVDYIASLDFEKQCEYFRISHKLAKSKVHERVIQYLTIMRAISSQPKSAKTIARENRLKLKSIRRLANKLHEAGVVSKNNGKYSIVGL